MLKEKDTPLDLMLRGFDQAAVLEMTGVDIGYHGAGLKVLAKGIDRFAYKVAHVKERVDSLVISQSLEGYADGAAKSAVLAVLGLAGENIVILRKLYAELGLAAEFKVADTAQRRGSMKSGMLAKYSVDNPFKLAEFQDKAGDTREEKYGARYTLAAGSVFVQPTHKATQGTALFDEGSALDLVCRGFQRDYVLAACGFDIGNKGGGVRTQLGPVDRFGYKVKHVSTRVGRDKALALLDDFGAGTFDRAGLLSALGLNGSMSVALCSLEKLFSEVGLGDELRQAKAKMYKVSSKKAGVTNMARYGGISPSHSPVVQAKMRASTLLNHGVENASQSEAVKEQKRQTLQANYGVDSPMQSSVIRGKAQATIKAAYGVDNVSQLDEIKAKKRATTQANYGVDYGLQSPEIRERTSATLRANFPDLATLAEGDVFPFHSTEVRDRGKATTLARYGVANVFSVPTVQATLRETIKARYGVDNVSQNEQIKARRTVTIRDQFGVDNAFQSESLKLKARKTNLARHGVEYVSQSEVVKAKVLLTKRANGTFHTSALEEGLYENLVDHFGVDDVVRQHRMDPRYPYACDFYVISRDLFIELNGSWGHGGHWFNPASASDQATVAKWQARGTDYYRNVETTWIVRDAVKRASARMSELNYVTFWDNKGLADAELWFALGAPDGRDWEREYSWLPQRELSLEGIYPAEISEGPRMATKVARAANWQEFYQRELVLWSSNKHPKWGTVQGHLYSNRLKYLGKLPHELTDLEILRGLSIAGMVRGWTTFDNTGMKAVLTKYEPKSIYDPCAGWGERLVTAAALGVSYLGTDINAAVVAGHARIVEQYGLSEQSTVEGDAALVDQREASHEMVFTCPPYGSTELYTEHGAENLGEVEFLAWWAQVVEQAVSPTTTVFAYQINQQWKGRMNAVLEAAGWRLDEQIAVGQGRASHFNRSKGVNSKREFEEVQVFVR